ncbi:MAG TPA: iron-sulfur cluster assembly scaffold protein [Caldisericia bacterium]|nr:iron-sulfur cluster assembly scaffold protein [Caldisericia bacterium]HOL82511.1 iron-sulfur cluster assembly scaffold protein [Caldisericia bacterium]HON82659.1 iron-sulfur cluster assembly scaffold protein [Caldisericia bacterium]HPC56753.1 iron-sulfur cluster assembly scaffold protein [Caldisericia bacterium]HPP43840.1 iron-sulfur cluster assembly scaffold protein [Caldisericia bacterium]
MEIYSKTFIDHFMNPRNVGEIEDADGIGIGENPQKSGKIVFYIKVKDNKLIDIKYKVLGCPSAISSSSLISEFFRDKLIENALKIDTNFLKENLGNLPEDVLECAKLSIAAFQNAILNYKKGGNYDN